MLGFVHICDFENEGLEAGRRDNPSWTLMPVPEPSVMGCC